MVGVDHGSTHKVGAAFDAAFEQRTGHQAHRKELCKTHAVFEFIKIDRWINIGAQQEILGIRGRHEFALQKVVRPWDICTVADTIQAQRLHGRGGLRRRARHEANMPRQREAALRAQRYPVADGRAIGTPLGRFDRQLDVVVNAHRVDESHPQVEIALRGWRCGI